MRRYFLLVILCTGIFFNNSADAQLRVALSKTYGTYEAWLKKAEPSVVIVNMYGLRPDSAVKLLETCSGLLLTGGEDVDPSRYGKQNELTKCEEIDYYRDTLEFALIDRAKLLAMPVFGICRGEQILNVAMGGSLLTDLPTDVGTAVLHRSSQSTNGCPHLINIEKNSVIYTITKIASDTVNSYHHQAIDRIAPGFRVTAHSQNGVAESMERINPEGKPFMMAVQWHPEKSTQKAELSKPLADYFVSYIKDYSKTLTGKKKLR
jgi:putative glutamine amidotransferase